MQKFEMALISPFQEEILNSGEGTNYVYRLYGLVKCRCVLP